MIISTGNISAVKFTIHTVDEHSVLVNITDPVTSIHRRQQQLSIRDVLQKELKYKISYYKSGSTGKVKYSTCTWNCAHLEYFQSLSMFEELVVFMPQMC